MATSKKNDPVAAIATEPVVEAAQPTTGAAQPELPKVATDVTSVPAEPNEAFFGSVLIVCLALSLIAATGYFGVAGYRYYQQYKAEQAAPSIESLPKAEVEVADSQTPTEIPPAQNDPTTQPNDETMKQAKAIAIKVLNGGAAKGSAGTVAAVLQKEGFTSVSVGNTLADFTGVTVYFASGLESAAGVVRTVLMSSYPKAEIKPVVTTNKETTAAPLTIILGKN